MRSPLTNITTVNGKNKKKRQLENREIREIMRATDKNSLTTSGFTKIKLEREEEEKPRHHNSICALCRAPVFTMWIRMGIGSPGRCSPLAVGTVMPTPWSTVASERT